jgi:pyruvate formate lyase activating enzyme
MKFAGIEKLSLTDYPKKVAATLFTQGCNFRCEYCHNKSLIPRTNGILDEKEVFSFFSKRINLLDALVITGGEPTLHSEELVSFCKNFKEIFPDKLLKIDTNGSNPNAIYELSGIADFCAMDFKSDSYKSFSDISIDVISESLEKIKTFTDYEVRTTCYPKYINQTAIENIIKILKNAGIHKVTLQQYKPISYDAAYTKDVIKGYAEMFLSDGITPILRGI